MVLCFSFSSLLYAQVVERQQFDRFTHYQPDDWITYAPASDITSIDIGEEYVYLGTRRGGVLRYHLYDQVWDYPLTSSNGLRSNRIVDLSYQFDDHTLYVKTPSGIDAYTVSFGYAQPSALEMLPPQRQPDPEAVQFYRQQHNANFPPFYRPVNRELPDFFLSRQLVYNNPQEILDSYNRVFRFNRSRVTDRFRQLWLGTNGLGVAMADLSSRDLHIAQHSISNIEVRDCLLDSSGIWIGGMPVGPEPHGITFWDDQNDTWKYFESRYNAFLDCDAVTTIIAAGDWIYFATHEGLMRFSKTKQEWNSSKSFHQLRQTGINDLLYADGRVYVASEAGLYWLYSGSDFIERFDDNRLDQTPIFKLGWFKGALLALTPFSIYTHNQRSNRFERFAFNASLPESGFSALSSDADSLWVAGSSGIAVLDGQSGSWQTFSAPAFTRLAPFYDIAFTPNHVWFASNGGLLKYDLQMQRWYLYSRRDGLASNPVYRIDTDGDRLWLSTAGGLTIFRWNRAGRVE